MEDQERFVDQVVRVVDIASIKSVLDLGPKSINIAKEFEPKENLKFKVGYSHQAHGRFDLVILNMVLQWIPRHLLIPTLNQIDQCGATFVFIKDFRPQKFLSSVSVHNPNVRIFKQDYRQMFTTFPFFQVGWEEVEYATRGIDFIRSSFLIKRVSLDEAYEDRPSVVENQRGKKS